MTTEIDTGHRFFPQYEPKQDLLRAFCRENEVPEPTPKLPSPWPASAATMAWTAQDLTNSHITHISEAQRVEIAAACNAYRESGKSLDGLDKASFPLPLLAGKLTETRRDLHHGPGISILRGVDPSSLSMREIFITFAGLASHVSLQRGQQSGGKAIVHITDLADTGRTALPAPYRNSPLPFHTDPAADVIAMFVIQASANGGHGIFCPVASIYNELATTRPDLLSELAKPDWPFDRPPDGVGDFYRRPVMFLGDVSAAPEMVFSRGALVRSPQGFRPSNIPLLTRRQGAALDALHFTAASLAYRVEYQKGDVLFFNNRRILHGREAFQDEGNGKRHLLRLWLRDEELAGTPPPPLDKVWEGGFAAGDEASIEARNEAEDAARWPLVPNGC